MTVFAVSYSYTADSETINQVRPAHRAFLAGLAEDEVILASGPTTDGQAPHALLLVQAASEQECWEKLDPDPFAVAGVIAERSARPWNPVIGQWTRYATS